MAQSVGAKINIQVSRFKTTPGRITADAANARGDAARFFQCHFHLRKRGRAFDLDIKTVGVRLAANGARLDALQAHARFGEWREKGAEDARLVRKLHGKRSAVVIWRGGFALMTNEEKLCDVHEVFIDRKLQQIETMEAGIAAAADGCRVRFLRGTRGGLRGAGQRNAARVRVLCFQPLIAMIKGHVMRIDHVHWTAEFSEQRELYIQRQFLADFQLAIRIHQAVHCGHDDAAG